jgi:hypothetical protein
VFLEDSLELSPYPDVLGNIQVRSRNQQQLAEKAPLLSCVIFDWRFQNKDAHVFRPTLDFQKKFQLF